jgi:hypothetical protein
MYVYCDIASFVPVGNTKSPLLRVCNVSGSYGEIVRVTFDRPFYVPVSRREFDTILIDIRNELGQPMPFEFGKSVVTIAAMRLATYTNNITFNSRKVAQTFQSTLAHIDNVVTV